MTGPAPTSLLDQSLDQKAREVWAAAIRHDLGGCHRRVEQLSSMVEDRLETADPDVLEAFSLIGDNAVRGQRIVASLAMLITLPERHTAERTDPRAAIDAAMQALHLEAAVLRNFSVDSESGRGTPLVAGQPALVEHALQPLLDNALHHGEPPVNITLNWDDRRVQLRVRSAGVPVNDAYLQHIRRPMQRGRNAPQHAAGLGLSIAERAAAQLGGSLTLEAGSPGGVVATLDLPRAP